MKNLFILWVVFFVQTGLAFSQSVSGIIFDTWSVSQKFHQFNEDHILIFGTSEFETWTNSKGFIHFFDEGLLPFPDNSPRELQDIQSQKPDSARDSEIFSLTGSSLKEIQAPEELKNASLPRINIFPNPAVDKLNVAIAMNSYATVDISLYNSIGNTVSRFVFPDKKQLLKVIDVENMNRGVYFLEIKTGGYKTIKKIILK